MSVEMATKATVSVTPVVTPAKHVADNSFNASFMNFVGDTLNTFTNMDVVLILRIILIWIAVVWLVFAIWATIDATSRYRKWYVPVLWFLFILPGNILGFIGYMLVRPALTVDEQDYLDLESKYIKYELLKVVECPQCGIVLDSDVKFCPNCGYKMITKCNSCGFEQSIFNKYCVKCGNPINVDIIVNKTFKISDKKAIIYKKAGNSSKKFTNDNVVNAQRTVFNKQLVDPKSPNTNKHLKGDNKVIVSLKKGFVKLGATFNVGIKAMGNVAEKVGDLTIKILIFPATLWVKVFYNKKNKKKKDSKKELDPKNKRDIKPPKNRKVALKSRKSKKSKNKKRS